MNSSTAATKVSEKAIRHAVATADTRISAFITSFRTIETYRRNSSDPNFMDESDRDFESDGFYTKTHMLFAK